MMSSLINSFINYKDNVTLIMWSRERYERKTFALMANEYLPDDEVNRLLPNFHTHLQNYTASQPRWLQPWGKITYNSAYFKF
jgi:hypothetical protein